MQPFSAVEHLTMLYNMKEEKHETHKLRPPFWNSEKFCYPHPSPKDSPREDLTSVLVRSGAQLLTFVQPELEKNKHGKNASSFK